MTFGLTIIGALVLILVLVWLSERKLNWMMRFQRQTHERISALEVNEVTQDIKIHEHGKLIKDLGKDVGWSDDERLTEVIKVDIKPPDKE